LHFAIGNTYYEQGKKQPASRQNWRKAVVAFNQALLTLSWEGFPLLHLDILQSLIKTLLSLGQTTQAQELQQRVANFLQQMLSDSTRTDENKKQLALKFAGIRQLAVDFFVESGDLVEAWELAEQGKNACLQWLLFGWQDEIYSPHYRTVQHLLNPNTAIIYWHISPAALHTFIIKDEAPSPILLFIPVQDRGNISFEGMTTPLQELPLPEAARRLIAFENWMEDWSQAYQDYDDKSHDPQTKSNHPWRSQMPQRLLELRDILEISNITQELEGITNLILIPHRDLHRVPLHILFNFADSETEIASPEKYNITYLPSIQTGLNLPLESISPLSNQQLLSIESPASADYATPKFAKLESQVVSQMFVHPKRIQEYAATKNAVEEALADNYDIFHFTGQVINNFVEPAKSELALAGNDKLILEEIYQKNLSSYNLAILSACRFASYSNHNITTEYVSLVNGFLCAAAPRVVSTLWNVESSASALLIIEFYRRLQANKSPATALTEATTWLQQVTARELTKWYEDLIKSLHPNELRIRTYLATHLYRLSKIVPDKRPYHHPYYWAAFILTGISN
jgi:CHAT domain-containing protein